MERFEVTYYYIFNLLTDADVVYGDPKEPDDFIEEIVEYLVFIEVIAKKETALIAQDIIEITNKS